MNIFSALTSKLFGGLSILLAVALAGSIVSHKATVAAYDKAINAPVTGWQARLSACTADLATARSNATTLRSQIDRQNEAVQSIQTAAANRYASGAVDRSEAVKQAVAAKAAAATLAKAKAGADVCASADALILETVK